MITIETFIKDIENTKDTLVSELAILNAKRDQLLSDISKLNSLIIEIKNTKE